MTYVTGLRNWVVWDQSSAKISSVKLHMTVCKDTPRGLSRGIVVPQVSFCWPLTFPQVTGMRASETNKGVTRK